MRRTDDTPMDPDLADWLESIDATLAGEPVSPRYAESAELALLLSTERPTPSPAFAQDLDERVSPSIRPSRFRCNHFGGQRAVAQAWISPGRHRLAVCHGGRGGCARCPRDEVASAASLRSRRGLRVSRRREVDPQLGPRRTTLSPAPRVRRRSRCRPTVGRSSSRPRSTSAPTRTTSMRSPRRYSMLSARTTGSSTARP